MMAAQLDRASFFRAVVYVGALASAITVVATPTLAQPSAHIAAGSTVRVVHARCFLCFRKTSEGSVTEIASDSMRLAQPRGSTAIAFRDFRWVGTPAPLSTTNGAISGAQQGLYVGFLLGGAGAIVLKSMSPRKTYSRTALLSVAVGGSTLGGALIGAAQKTTRWRKVEKHSWPNAIDSVVVR